MLNYNKKSNHIITSRSKGAGDRIVVLLLTVFLLFMIICSAYAISYSLTNPAAWSMLSFFGVALFILLGHEQNIFPDLTNKKTIYAIIVWFFAFIFIAYLVSAITTFSFAHALFATIFGVVVVLGGMYILFPEVRWVAMKQNVKAKTGGRIKKAVRNSRVGKKLKNRKAKKQNKNKRWRKGGL